MKTFKMKTNLRSICFITLIMMSGLFSDELHSQTNTVQSEQFTVSGVVSDDKGSLPGVNVVLKGESAGTITDENGIFTFPKALNSGDVLVFSFLGYETQEVKIDAQNTVIKLTMSTDLIEIMGAPNSNVPYKSKR